MNRDLKLFLFFAAFIVALLWVFEAGPFAKRYPPTNSFGGCYEPTFTGGLSCNKCGCTGWAGSTSHGGECGRKIGAGVYCTHTYTEHKRAAGY